MKGDKPDGPEVLADMVKQVGVNINVPMTGVTKNPKEVLDTFTDEYGCTKDSIEMLPIQRIVCMMQLMKDTLIYTWSLIDKQGLGKLYKEHDLMESLFPLTYSCEYYPKRQNVWRRRRQALW